MKERVIRRYANRKMYDVETSRYVSLSDLAAFIRNGESICVTNKKGDKDYTAQVLRQIILEQGKESGGNSVFILHEWVRLGGSFLDNQWEEIRSGLEEWIKGRSTTLLNSMKREDFITLKKKVDDLEKKINALDQKKKKN